MRIHTMISRLFLSGALFLFAFCGIAGAMELTVILPGDRSITVNTAPEETVAQLKQTIFSISSLSVENQTLSFKGNHLTDGTTLSSLGISEGDTVQVSHDTHSATGKMKSPIWWVILLMLVIAGIGILFMRKKSSWEYDGK